MQIPPSPPFDSSDPLHTALTSIERLRLTANMLREMDQDEYDKARRAGRVERAERMMDHDRGNASASALTAIAADLRRLLDRA